MADLIPYSDENLRKIIRVGESIVGSCRSLDAELQEAFGDDGLTVTDFDIKLLEALDDTAMECQGCGWWHDPGDLDDDQLCEDCQ